MGRFRPFRIALMLLTASNAFSQDLRYNFYKTADFSKFKTYVWVTIKNVAGNCCHPNLPELFTGTRLAA